MNTVARLAKEAAAASPADSIPTWCRNSLPPACHSDPIELAGVRLAFRTFFTGSSMFPSSMEGTDERHGEGFGPAGS